MDAEYLNEYVERELSIGHSKTIEINSRPGLPKNNLRTLYGVPADKKFVYSESGGITNLPMFPSDTTLIVSIFPWTKNDIEKF